MQREDLRFRRAAVAVQIAGDRITAGPAVRLIILEIHHVVLHDSSNGIAPVVRPADVGPFFADQHMIAQRIHVAGFLRCEDVEQTASRRGEHCGILPCQARRLQHGRRKIDEADEVVDPPPGGTAEARLPRNGQRQAVRGVVCLPLDAREGHAVVARDDDDRVLQQPAPLESIEHPAEVPIEVLDLERVVEHVVADGFVVGPIRWHAVDVAQFLSADADARAIFIRPVRLAAAVPEEPRLAVLRATMDTVEEIVEIGGVVVVADEPRRRRGVAPRKPLAGELSLLAVGSESDARRPTLAGAADEIAVGRQGFGEDVNFRREVAPMIAGCAELPRVSAGEDAGPRRGAFSFGRVSVREQQSLRGNAIERVRLDPLAGKS